jgi:hypothetical protein
VSQEPPVAKPTPEIPPGLEPPEPAAEMFVEGSPGGVRKLGLVVKRTYAVRPEGSCELAGPGEQERVVDEPLLYWNLEPPDVSPLALDDDTKAFRHATDLVVQGRTHTYGTPQVESTVAVAFRDFRREIAVKGDRRLERMSDGGLRFTSPEPFEEMYLLYSRAYGGFDAVALERNQSPQVDALDATRPEYGLKAATPFHYPRNPSGQGFLIESDDESIERAHVPNLEFAFDPLTPERLVVGAPENWIRGPVPASFDWLHPYWFPRSAYLGTPAELRGYQGSVAEIEWGFAAQDLLQVPSFLKNIDELTIRPEYFQAASPGMSFPSFDPREVLRLTNLHPDRPDWTVRLPGLVPQFDLGIQPPFLTRLEPHLNAVVLRPEENEVVMTWCVSAPVERGFSPEQVQNMRCEENWMRSG